MTIVTSENQGRGRPTVFTRDVVRKLRHFIAEGMTYAKMGELVDIHPRTIRMFISRHRDELNVEKRKRFGFDKEWYGYVPRGHWMISKPWGSERFYGVLRRANRLGVGVDTLLDER